MMILKTRLMRRGLIFSTALSAALSAAIFPAAAITANDVMKKMNQDTRFGYLSGLVDMLAYQTAANGDRTRGDCITDMFYREKDNSWPRLLEVLEKFPDKRPDVLVSVLANQLCTK